MKSFLSAAAVFVLVTGVARAQLPTEDELKETAKTAGTGALEGAATAAGEVAKDPSGAKKHMGGAAKKVAVGGVRGAQTAVTTKKTVKTTTTTTTVKTETQPATATPATAAPVHAPPN